MISKKYLGFLILNVVMVISMFNNVFANYSGGWTCIKESRTQYSVGENIYQVSNMKMSADGQHTEYCELTSNFDVYSGDTLSLIFCCGLYGDESKFESSASMCSVKLIAENGTVLMKIYTELNGNNIYFRKKESVNITPQTEGKLTYIIGLEGTGTNGVVAELDDETCLDIEGREL